MPNAVEYQWAACLALPTANTIASIPCTGNGSAADVGRGDAGRSAVWVMGAE